MAFGDSAGVTQLIDYLVPSGDQQTDLHHRTHPTTQKMESVCLRRKPGSSRRLPRALRTGLVVRGCLFSSCSLSPPGHPTHRFSHLHEQPGPLWHTQKGVYFSSGGEGPENVQETSCYQRGSLQGGPRQDLGPSAPKQDYPPLLIWTLLAFILHPSG